VATAGAVPGGRCACPGLHGLVQLPQSRDLGRTPRSDYHEKGCFRFGHDDDPVLPDLRLDVVLPERHDGALHNHQLRLQRDPEDCRSLEDEGIRMVATRRPLGSRIQSPPPAYNSGEEHHDLQQRTSQESSPDNDDWICLFEDRLRSPSPTRRSRLRPQADQNVRRGRRGLFPLLHRKTSAEAGPGDLSHPVQRSRREVSPSSSALQAETTVGGRCVSSSQPAFST
jgi:hypothetical protein